MSAPELQRAEDLPPEYSAALRDLNVLPAWTLLRSIMPVGAPVQLARATHWSYDRLRPQLMRAAEVVPIEKAERRVLAYVNPGLDSARMATMPTIFFGLQLIMPGERAPSHKHIPSAARLILEGSGAYTSVNGENLPMEPGDLILTPPLHWHEHGHEGAEPVIWMDVLDHPLAVPMDVSYVTPRPASQINERPDASGAWYSAAGLVPYRLPGSAAPDYPLMRFRWKAVREALTAIAGAAASDEPIHLRYVNPETGQSALKSLDFSARLIRAGEVIPLPRHSVNQVFQIVAGSVEVDVNGSRLICNQHDSVAVPTYAKVVIANPASRGAYIIQVDDAPAQTKLGFYERLDDPASPASQ